MQNAKRLLPVQWKLIKHLTVSSDDVCACHISVWLQPVLEPNKDQTDRAIMMRPNETRWTAESEIADLGTQ